MIDYLEWSQQYEREAEKILNVIEQKKKLLRDASADTRKSLNEQIISYRMIYYDLMRSSRILCERAHKESSNAA